MLLGRIASGEPSPGFETPATPPIQSEMLGSPCGAHGCARLREGKELLAQGSYAAALERLGEAYESLPVVRDYALLFMAQAHTESKRFGSALACIEELLRDYPESPLKKKARSLQIQTLMKGGDQPTSEAGDALTKSFEQYIADYPDDGEMKLLFGRHLKKRGEPGRAKSILKEVYLAHSSLSDAALRELGASDITARDIIEKASNLMKNQDYKRAEGMLRKLIAESKPPLKEEIGKKLGLALFRQKRYREAAQEFSRAGDVYDEARSRFRAGDREGFLAALAKLVSMEDRRAGSLMIALASKTRREGKVDEALTIYRRVKERYPSLGEEALWGMAWTSYRRGDYRTALGALSELTTGYPSSRYSYWTARSVEHLERENPTSAAPLRSESLYRDTASRKNDFYGLLGDLSLRKQSAGLFTPIALPVSPPGTCPGDAPVVTDHVYRRISDWYGSLSSHSHLRRLLDRFSILMSIGMPGEAITEVVSGSRDLSSPNGIVLLSLLLKESGAYKKAITMASRAARLSEASGTVPADIDDIQYPLAYWPVVSDAARTNSLDPLIILSVMREESRFDPDAYSIAGAVGLMQIMPQTAEVLSQKTSTKGAHLRDAKTNITLGAYYLKALLREFGSLPLALAAYNAGEERVDEWISRGDYTSLDEFIEDIPYEETRTYVQKVLLTYSVYRQKSVHHAQDCRDPSS